jgi:3-dehydroquinate dehydratase / shikimate dehydrogenase
MVEAKVHLSRAKTGGRALLFGQERICVVVAEKTAARTLNAFQRALTGSRKVGGSRTIELRLDWLSSAREVERLLARLRVNPKKVCVIATLRRRAAGGKYAGGLREQMALLRRAAEAGCAWCDVEVESAERLDADALKELRGAGARVMISFHDFRATPRNLNAVVRRLDRCGGDAIKIAAQSRTLSDSAKILALARGRRDVVAVPMGEAGLPARVLALRAGSALAYAAANQATAPGQLSADEMRGLYRAEKLDGRTRVYGVIGNPIAHSLSPLMHNAAFAARHVNAVLLPFLVGNLKDFLAAFPKFGVKGFAITLPHKQAIIPHLDGCDPLAARIGAVNTVVVRGDGGLYGYNTDYVGVLRALSSRVELKGSRVLLLGAGGAARAAAFALVEAGAVVCICARREAQAAALARAAGGEAIARAKVKGEFFDAIVNATSLGLRRTDAIPLRADELNCRVVMDMIYRPMRTKFLRMAERRGIETVSGAEMFIAQGIAQWEIWMGERAPVETMRRITLSALRQEEKRARG